jgi:hypothetical protein
VPPHLKKSSAIQLGLWLLCGLGTAVRYRKADTATQKKLLQEFVDQRHGVVVVGVRSDRSTPQSAQKPATSSSSMSPTRVTRSRV